VNIYSVCRAILTVVLQNPPLYLHVTSTTKAGLEKAVEKIEELMQQELPNLVDERRFRRREPDQFERDEFGRVRYTVSPWRHLSLTVTSSANGPRNASLSTWNQFPDSIFVPKL
jgi:hypothetical protein